MGAWKAELCCALALAALGPSGARAEEPACAAKLNHDAALIYAEIRKADPPAAEFKAKLTEIVEGMVKAGQIERASARANAVSAYECMESH